MFSCMLPWPLCVGVVCPHVYDPDRSISGTNLRPGDTKQSRCIDMVGTDHPARLPCIFPSTRSTNFCNPVEVFMMIREPVERLWSAYMHHTRITQEREHKTDSVSTFLTTQRNIKV